MNKPKHLSLCLLMSSSLLSGLSATAESSQNPPNILLILIDDMGWKDIGCAGSVYYETPHIDALSAAGIQFDQAYSSSPVCAPSRGAIFSGKNPARTKFTTVGTPGAVTTSDRLYEVSKTRGGGNQFFEAPHRRVLPKTETLFSESLKEAGYTTGFFGKWHCGSDKNYTPDQRGFQIAKGYRYPLVGTAASRHWGKTFNKYSVNLPTLADDTYVADALTQECIDFMRENKSKPFLAVLSHYLVHAPVQPKPEKLAKYKNKPTTDQNNPAYAAMVESVDESVGRLMDTLKELGLEKNTLVVFTSDNGGHTANTSNYPLMGGKSFSFEAGMRVPLIMRWPKVVRPGRRTTKRTISMDLYPTFLAAAGVPLQPENHTDGVSLIPILKADSGTLEKRPLIFHFPHYTGSTSPYSSIIDGKWKLIHFYNDAQGAYLLFDMENDPYEQRDLSEHPEKSNLVRQLAKELDRELKSMDAEMPIPNPDHDPASKRISNRKTTTAMALKRWATAKKKLNQN